MDTVTLEHLQKSAQFLTQRLELDKKPRAHVAVILGSGLGPFANEIKNGAHYAALPFGEVPYFSSSTVQGHKGEIIYGTINGDPILALNGRLHLYEGLQPQQVIVPIRVLGLLGIKTLILTNASGGIGDNFEPGHLMVVADHINFTGTSPLVGKNYDELGPRFVDMSEAYDKDLRTIAKRAAEKVDIKMHEGVYAGLLGPCYETPSEVRMLKKLGVDAVGMSTVFETIAARHMGLKVLAISCITNKACGLSSQKITHEEVMENNAKVAAKLGQILTDIIGQIS